MACIMVHSRNFTRYQILTLHRTSNKGVATFHLLYTIVILRHLPGVGLGRQVDLKDNACLLSRGSCSFFCKAVDAKCFLLHKKQNGKRENQKWMKFDQTESQVFRLQSKTKVSMNFMFLSKPKSLTFKTEILERTRDLCCFEPVWSSLWHKKSCQPPPREVFRMMWMSRLSSHSFIWSQWQAFTA